MAARGSYTARASGYGHTRKSAGIEGSDSMAVLWTGCGSILEAVVTALGAESGARSARRLAVQRRRCWGYVERVECSRALHCSLADIYYPLTFRGSYKYLVIFFFLSLGYWTLADVF